MVSVDHNRSEGAGERHSGQEWLPGLSPLTRRRQVTPIVETGLDPAELVGSLGENKGKSRSVGEGAHLEVALFWKP